MSSTESTQQRPDPCATAGRHVCGPPVVPLAELDTMLRRDAIYGEVRDSEFAWWARTHGPELLEALGYGG